jgi:hypothetical protein
MAGGFALTRTSTVATLRASNALAVWDAEGLRQNDRCFLHTNRWLQSYLKLPGSPPKGFWLGKMLILPGQELRAAVEAFVSGEPWERFQPPHGAAMEPVFARRWHPNHAVVALKTRATRTLGFFTSRHEFVAISCGLAGDWHAEDDKVYQQEIEHAAKVVGMFDPSEVDGATDVRDIIG